MTFRKLMMLAGIGGLVYAHRKRGGQMTLESFKQSGHGRDGGRYALSAYSELKYVGWAS